MIIYHLISDFIYITVYFPIKGKLNWFEKGVELFTYFTSFTFSIFQHGISSLIELYFDIF